MNDYTTYNGLKTFGIHSEFTDDYFGVPNPGGGGGTVVCGFPCYPQEENKHCHTDLGPNYPPQCLDPAFIPFEGVCTIMSLRGFIESVEGYEYALSEFELSEFYRFRDELLGKSVRGREYVRMYYIFGAYINLDDWSISEILDYISFVIQMKNLANNFGDENYHDILIDTQFYNVAQGYINEFSSVSSESDYQNALAVFSADLDTFLGMPADDVRNYFVDSEPGCSSSKRSGISTKISSEIKSEIAPNPSKSSLKLTVSDLSKKYETVISIYDNRGIQMFTRNYGSISSLSEQISLPGGKGIYFVKIENGSRSKVEKFLVVE